MGALLAVSMLKGGVSKTTVAVTLAVHLQRLGRKVVLLDADPQQTASRWIHQIDPDFPAVTVRRSVDMRDTVIEAVREAQRMGDVIVSDPPPSDPAVMRTLLGLCDLALIPTGDNVEELYLCERTIQAAQQEAELRREPIPCLIVRSRFDRSNLSSDAEQGVHQFGVPVAEAILRQRVSWRLAMSDGVAIFDLPASRHADAIREATALCEEVTQRIDGEHDGQDHAAIEPEAEGRSGDSNEAEA